MRVLIIEDEPICAELVREFLKPYSTSVHYSDNLADCFKYVDGLQFDLIVLDLRLKDSTADNTIDCIGEIRACQEHAGIVIMSGMSPVEYFRKRSLENGADCFLPKDPNFCRNALYLAVVAAARKHNGGGGDEAAQINHTVDLMEAIATA